MLRKQHRVRKEAFETVFKKGRTYRSSLFSLRIGAPLDASTYAAAFVVPKKVARRAVERNRIRRRCYHALSALSSDLKAPFTAIFIVRTTLRDVSSAGLREEMKTLLSKAGVY